MSEDRLFIKFALVEIEVEAIGADGFVQLPSAQPSPRYSVSQTDAREPVSLPVHVDSMAATPRGRIATVSAQRLPPHLHNTRV